MIDGPLEIGNRPPVKRLVAANCDCGLDEQTESFFNKTMKCHSPSEKNKLFLRSSINQIKPTHTIFPPSFHPANNSLKL
jgi:hypothetical protein